MGTLTGSANLVIPRPKQTAMQPDMLSNYLLLIDLCTMGALAQSLVKLTLIDFNFIVSIKMLFK